MKESFLGHHKKWLQKKVSRNVFLCEFRSGPPRSFHGSVSAKVGGGLLHARSDLRIDSHLLRRKNMLKEKIKRIIV